LKKLKEISGSESMKSAFNNFITSYGKTSGYRKHFLIPSKGDKLIPVQTSDLACFCINAGVVKGFSFDGKAYIFDHTLEELEEMLDPELFFRANRQYIISRRAISDIDLWFNSRLSVNLKISVPDKILISKARIGEFKNWFGK
jgi:DNA-binding LytR/AlgR family response regulator